MSKPLTEALEAQGSLKPGDEGWWRVWGACARDILPGDLVMLKYSDTGEVYEYEVKEYAPRTADHESVTGALEKAASGTQLADMRDLLRPRFRSGAGDLFSVGQLQKIVVLRRGTCGTLADSVR